MRIKTSAIFAVMVTFFLIIQNTWSYAEDAEIYTWENCVRIALINNPDLLSSRELIIQSSAAKGITRSALLPEISATASGGKSSKENSEASDSYSYDISAKQLIFDGFKSIYDLKGANKDIETAMYDYSAESAAVRLDLKNAFTSLLKNQDKLKILEEIQGRRKHIMNLVKMRYDGGSEHRGSYLSAKSDYLQSEADVKSTLREISLSKKTLSNLMGLKDSTRFSIKGNLILPEKNTDKPDFIKLAADNPTYLKSVSASESAMYSLKSSELAFSPKVYGTASAGKTGDSPDSMSGNWSLGFEITAPLFEGGETWYGYSKAESVYRQTQSDRLSVKNEIVKSLEESWNSFMNSIDNVEVKRAALTADLERSKIGESQYSIGTLTFDNWTIIESNLASAKTSYLSACAEALTAEAEWIKSKGGTLEDEK